MPATFDREPTMDSPVHGVRSERGAITEALRKVRDLLASSRGDSSHCTVFEAEDPFHHRTGDMQAERAYLAANATIYIETWIEPILEAALASMEGRTTAEQRRLLDNAKAYYLG